MGAVVFHERLERRADRGERSPVGRRDERGRVGQRVVPGDWH